MPYDFRVYGHLVGLDYNTLQIIKGLLAGYECQVIDEHILDFVHEGIFIDIDGDLENLVQRMPPHGRGLVDIINHIDWEMTRCTLAQGKITRTRIALDNALDTAYASEHRD
ncbi:MAG: hypothetical protein RBR42_12425 [Desulfomicrobium sp.]|jgi:hypothetical protein|nr:hypothetical protein [Desulfomicrobium sp.]NLV96168.1 hypothetical protein [Desulfovibrionales bacterium]